MMFPIVVELTVVVFTAKFVDVAPAGTVTEPGTEAAEFALVKLTIEPPTGAPPVSVTVAVADWPPVTVEGLTANAFKAADDAVKLARRVKKLSGQFPAELKVALLELGEESRRMFATALRLFTDYSPELAQEIIANDVEVDTRYTAARNRVIEMIRENPENSESLDRTIDSFHALEHVADHAVEIARRMRMLYEARPS